MASARASSTRFLTPNGSSPTSRSATPAEPAFLDQRVAELGDLALLASRERQRQRVGEKAAARERMRADA